MSGTIGTSSYGPLDLVLAGATSLRQQYANLQEQTTTGLISQSYSGLAPSSVSQFMDLTAVSNQNTAYTNSITMAQGKASVMQTALTQIATLLSTVTASALSISASSSATDLTSMQQQAGQALTQMVSLLNSTYAGDYVFSGANTSSPSVNGATPPVLSVNASTDVQIGPSNSVTLGLSTPAGTGAINAIMSGLSAMANPTSTTGEAAAAALFISAPPAGSTTPSTTSITAYTATLNQESGQIGLAQTAMTAASTSYASMQTILTTQITNLTQVDMATAVSKMQAVNTQLQSSYQVLAEMGKLNLASYL